MSEASEHRPPHQSCPVSVIPTVLSSYSRTAVYDFSIMPSPSSASSTASPCPTLGPHLVPSVAELNLSSTAPWQPHADSRWRHHGGTSRRNSSHPHMYWPQPLESHHDFAALRETILSNQFPADPAACNRTLLFYDNSVGGGLGYTAKMMGYALLIAVQERRVLILLPGNPSYDAKAYGHDHAHSTTRWCTRPPHSH